MKDWWKERFINKRDWVLDHLEELAVNSDEVMTILLIDFMNQHQITITHGILAHKLKMEADVIDDILSKLTAKGYLQLEFKDGKIRFAIDGIFEEQKDQAITFDESLFELFETEFARPLSQMELQRMADWLNTYDQKMIAYALREALTYEHKSFDYIETILESWKNRGLRAEEYEEGKR